MNKKLFLLPFLATSLLVGACNKPKPQPKIWELAEVEGESTIAQVKAGEEKAYYTVRGTVVSNSGSTLAIYRKGQFLYCYNFRAGEHENLQAHPLGSYVEIHAQSSKYSGSVQLTAYNVGEQKTQANEETGAVGKYDLAASCKVLEAQGETVNPVALSADADFTNANAAGMYQKVSFVPDDDYTLTTAEDPTKETDQYINGRTENFLKHDLKLEKFLVGQERTTLLTNNPTTFEAGATYEVVGMGAATSSGNVRTVLGEGASWRKTAEAHFDAPTSVVVGADGDPETIEKGDNLQLTFAILPTTARQKVTWTSSNNDIATVDKNGKVTAVELGNVTISATSVQDSTKVGTYALEVVKPSAKPLTESIKFDFTSRTEKGTYLDQITGGATAVVKAATSEALAAHVQEATSSTVTSGNGNGGAYPNTSGFLKFGSSSSGGSLEIKLDALVNKVELKVHDWNKKSETYPTNSNKIAVNEAEAQLLPYTTDGTPAVLTFMLAEAASTLTIATGNKQRGFLFEITVSYVEPNA